MESGIVYIPLAGQPMEGRCEAAGAATAPAPSRAPSTEGRGGAQSAGPGPLPYFIAGPENRLVETAVRYILDKEGGRWDPVAFHGASGCGKTHLARGLETAWKCRYPRHERVHYTTATDFARELTDAAEAQALDEFRSRHRQVALLIFEDLGRLAGAESAQEEVLNTLDALRRAGSRVVVTASAAVPELTGLMPGLRSRLTAGLTVSIVLPGRDARLVVLREIARLRGLALDESAAQVLAGGLEAGVPVLRGALVQLEAAARLNGGKVTRSMARRWVARHADNRQPPLGDVAAATAKYFALRVSELRGPSRRRAVATARCVAMFLARQLTRNSLEQVGRYFGDRDHATVLYNCRKTARLLASDPTVRRAVDELGQRWQASCNP